MILCDNAKAAGITIYTMQVNTGGDPTSAVLQYCAANARSFYWWTSASQTASVFSQIGASALQVARLEISAVHHPITKKPGSRPGFFIWQ